jgi:hypothetical protein
MMDMVLAHLELLGFARISGVSTDPNFHDDLLRASRRVSARLERAGAPPVETLKMLGTDSNASMHLFSASLTLSGAKLF